MPHRVVVNLDLLRSKPQCDAQCSYPFRKPDAVAGPSWLRQKAGFEVFCRRCDDHPCVHACPFDALEHLEGGLIKRYNLRCVGCNSCMVACPFGTIVPAALVYKDGMCDLCVGRDKPAPLCCQTCPDRDFTWEDLPDAPADKDLRVVADRLAVRSKTFLKIEPTPVKKK